MKNLEYSWRRVPSPVRCHLTANSEPPCPINASSITITQLTFTDEILNISYHWHPPSIPNGQIQQYQSRIAAEPLLPDQDSHPTHLPYLKSISEVIIWIVQNTFWFIHYRLITQTTVSSLIGYSRLRLCPASIYKWVNNNETIFYIVTLYHRWDPIMGISGVIGAFLFLYQSTTNWTLNVQDCLSYQQP